MVRWTHCSRSMIEMFCRAGSAGQGRFLGGRPPYGYRLVDAGPHPNRAHAAWGRRCQQLSPDPATAPHVRWMFAERLTGRSVASIARELNEQGVPCPSAADPERNRHRSGQGWNLRSVAVILANPRYTGRQVWSRHRSQPGAGRSTVTGEWAVSRTMSHPALVSEADFIAVQQCRAARRCEDGATRDYVLAGLVQCRVCGRRMDSHRLADGWQASTVRAILENPRYTGYAFFGRWTRKEVLLDPDDVAAGHVIRFRRVGPEKVVRSRKPAHPALVSVDDFIRAQLLRRTRSAGGMVGIAKLEREKSVTRDYLLRGRVRCALCERKMQGGIVRSTASYRCRARTLAPGSAALAAHPCTVNLREDVVTARINEWIGSLFVPQNRDATVRALVASQGDPGAMARGDAARQQLAEAEATLRRFQEAIAAGVDPTAVVDPINRARAERDAARACLAHPEQQPELYTEAQVRVMVDELGDIGAAIGRARPDRLASLYRKLDLGVRYEPSEFGGSATVTMRVANECVRGRTRPLRTRSPPGVSPGAAVMRADGSALHGCARTAGSTPLPARVVASIPSRRRLRMPISSAPPSTCRPMGSMAHTHCWINADGPDSAPRLIGSGFGGWNESGRLPCHGPVSTV
jgi:Recombinase